MRSFKKRFSNISLTSMIILVLIFISVFFTWQNARLRNQIRKLNQGQVIAPTLSPEPADNPTPTPPPTETNIPEASPDPREQDGCVITGCSGQICSSEEATTTCEFLAEYACYQDTICELQEDGECGWSETNELLQCLADTEIENTKNE